MARKRSKVKGCNSGVSQSAGGQPVIDYWDRDTRAGGSKQEL